MKVKAKTLVESNPNFLPDIQRLDEILKEAKGQLTRCLSAHDQNISDVIHNQLLSIGVSLVRFPPASVVPDLVKVDVGEALVRTFPKLTQPVQEELKAGEFKHFFSEVEHRKYKVLEIAFKTRGMLNQPPLAKADRDTFTHPITGAVHIHNPLAATLPLRVWESITTVHPLLNSTRWFNNSLLEKDHTVQVSEDGVKLTDRWTYDPTPIHFDNQGRVSNPLSGETGRVQVAYCQDTGPVRLFVVPGSNKPEVRQILQKLTRCDDIVSGFSTFDKAYPEIPIIRELFYKYGVALPTTGLLIFCAGVMHYEAVQKETPTDDRVVETRCYYNGSYDPQHIEMGTLASHNFRVFIGLKAIPHTALDACVTHAYLRQHGWSMEPFAPKNKQSAFFINEKHGQSGLYLVYNHPDAELFHKLAAVPLPEMKQYLLNNCSFFRLMLYGLSPQMLSE